MQETILIEVSILACEEFIKTLLHEDTHRTENFQLQTWTKVYFQQKLHNLQLLFRFYKNYISQSIQRYKM